MNQKIRIKLKSFDHNLVDKSAEKIVKTVRSTDAMVSGPVPLPTRKQIFTVNRSTFVNKKAREQFQFCTFKRIIDIYSSTPKTIDALMDFSRKTGKDPIWVRKEIDGFIANRFVRVIKNEACYLLEEGIATAQEIDTALEKGLNYPMGPFRLMDLTGVDLSYLASKRVYEETGVKQPGFDALKAKYEAGEWGRKTGKGWYDYSETKK